MGEDWPLSEKMAYIAADLLSEKRYKPSLRGLFAAPPGVWHKVSACCTDTTNLPDFAAEVFAEHDEQFVVTHLPWPGLPVDDPGCAVLFGHGDELWSMIAYFNRASLDDA